MTPTIEASGPHDFTVRFSAVRQPAVLIAHGKPALQSLARLTLPRPPLPAPRVAAIMIRPFGGTGWRKYRRDYNSIKQKYFLDEGWTGPIDLIWLHKLISTRIGFCVKAGNWHPRGPLHLETSPPPRWRPTCPSGAPDIILCQNVNAAKLFRDRLDAPHARWNHFGLGEQSRLMFISVMI